MGEETNEPVRVAISSGDLNGIGLELALRIFSDPAMLSTCIPILYAPAKTLAFYRKHTGADQLAFTNWKEGSHLQLGKCYVKNIDEVPGYRCVPGESTTESAAGGLASLEAATADVLQGHADVLVTGPISKQKSTEAGFNFPGHTEYVGSQTGGRPLMLMVYDRLRVALATGHIALSEVSASLNPQQLLSKLDILEKTLREDFGVRKPRIALLSVNPHAGDGGKFGNEEQEILLQVLQAKKDGAAIYTGPWPADGFFGAGLWKSFDAVMAMYHDQGLIPFKALSAMEGVNYTAGLPIIRTSPDHGPAFDIAGSGKADPASMRNAIYLAVDLFRQRSLHKKISENPLRPLSRELKEVNPEEE